MNIILEKVFIKTVKNMDFIHIQVLKAKLIWIKS